MNVPFKSVGATLQHWTNQFPEKTAYTFLADGENQEVHITYQALDLKARAIAATLQKNVAKGDRVLLLFPSSIDFIAAFYGCLYAGVIAVPAFHKIKQNPKRLLIILEDAAPNLVLTNNKILREAEKVLDKAFEAEKWLTLDTINDVIATNFQEVTISVDSVAFLQYTSGSTTQPKGVMVTHENLLYQFEMMASAMYQTSDTRIFTWLPLYHDMGLIGNALFALYLGGYFVFMSPISFLKKPIRWLKAISKYKIQMSGAPNFAFELVLNKSKKEDFEGLDLRSWGVAFCGAEPIRQSTIAKFEHTFEPYGFQKTTLFPCYGLAEATLMVTGAGIHNAWTWLNVDKEAIEQSIVKISAEATTKTKPLVASGLQFLEQSIKIVQPETLEVLDDDRIGEIWIAGKHVAKGYWNKPTITRNQLQAKVGTSPLDYLRTGDLGFFHKGQLFITGRIKDLIKIRGRGIYPQDLEYSIESLRSTYPEIKEAGVFSFEQENKERIAALVEIKTRLNKNHDPKQLSDAIMKIISEQFEVALADIVFIRSGTLPKTTSGKIQRHACQKLYLSEFKDHIPPLYQVLKVRQLEGIKQHQQSQEKATELIQWIRKYAEKRINSRLIDERRTIPPYIVLDFGNKGLLAMQVPESYGGLGLMYTDMLRVLEQLAGIDLTLAIFTGLNNGLGIHPILHFASDKNKQTLLPILAAGRGLAAFAITEKEAGSNPLAMGTVAIKVAGGWQISGQKIWTGSGSWAEVISVFAKTSPTATKQGIVGLLVRQDAEGLRHGAEALTTGLRGMVQNTVYFDNVFVPDEDVLGTIDTGFDVAQRTMMHARLRLASVALGGMKRCAQLMYRYANRRQISTGRLLDNVITQLKLSDLTSWITASEALLYQTTQWIDKGIEVPKELYIVNKIIAPELLTRATDSLIQLLGGRGYIETNIAPQLHRDARIIRIFEGPTETLTMHLGALLNKNSQPIITFLSHYFKASEEATQLLAMQKIVKKAAATYHFGKEVKRTHFINTNVGQLASYLFVIAALRYEQVTKGHSAQHEQAIKWARRTYDELLFAMQQQLRYGFVTDSDFITDTVKSYEGSIGNVEQRLPGEEVTLDFLLEKEEEGLYDMPSFDDMPDLFDDDDDDDDDNSFSVTTSSSQHLKTDILSKQELKNWLIDWLSSALNIPINQIQSDEPLANYGLDSLSAIELVEALEQKLNLTISNSLVYDYQTVNAIVDFLCDEVVNT